MTTATCIIRRKTNVGEVLGFVLNSSLDYSSEESEDRRLDVWQSGHGRWFVAEEEGQAAGIACLVELTDGERAEHDCLFWLEVAPAFQGCGLGQALLEAVCAAAQPPLVIQATPSSASFYRCALASVEERPGNLFVLDCVQAS